MTERRALRAAALEELGRQLGALSVTLQATSTATAQHFHPALPPATFHVARWLATFGPARVGAIAAGVAMDRAAVSRLVHQLHEQRLVATATDSLDRRAQLVRLTPQGERELAKALDWKASEFFQRLEHWTVVDLRTLAALLERLTALP